MNDYDKIIDELIQFRDDRNWEQFHDSKNLALALSIEAAELNELFLWKKDNEANEVNDERLREELADVLSYAFLLANKHSINIFEAISAKIKLNAKKYPIEKARGTSKKYTQL